jgi:mRNA export factor
MYVGNIRRLLILIQSIYIPGFALGSVEGRVAIQYVTAQNPKDNFTFKCHRSNGMSNGFQDIYAVNDIAFHPIHGTLATVGSDGRYSFWDKASSDVCTDFY